METKLMYRILRKLSAWTVGGWYSDVYVDGVPNVPPTGPLILASTHHNEIIDIAVLSTTTPHERPICFWAKSTMFKHPVTKIIMESSGAIRVKRNPNRVSNSSPTTSTEEPSSPTASTSHANGTSAPPPTSYSNSTQEDLFKDTSYALSRGEVIGVFPEGTSYTLPAIAQILPGAAWAAVEYVRFVREGKLAQKKTDRERQVYLKGEGRYGEKTGLAIVPVGIVYEDKKKYMSRIRVGFGERIDVDPYTRELFAEGVDPEEAAKSVVKKLNAEIERKLIGLTINAPDWETLYAARTAMKILWKDPQNVPLENWVRVSQSLAELLSSTDSDKKRDQLRKSLMRYYSLLYYTGIDHTILEDVLPTSSISPNLNLSLLSKIFSDLATDLPLSLIRFIAFVPAFMFHIPGYIASHYLVRVLYTPGEEETEAQYRAVGGGLGIGFSVLLILGWLWIKGVLANWGFLGGIKGIIGLSLLVYASVYVLVKWHLMLVEGNLTQLRRLTTFGKLVLGTLFPGNLRTQELQMYSTPPPPPVNVFIKKDASNASSGTAKHPPPVSPNKLVRELLHARLQAHINLGNYLRSLDSKEVTFLLSQGGRIPYVVS